MSRVAGIKFRYGISCKESPGQAPTTALSCAARAVCLFGLQAALKGEEGKPRWLRLYGESLPKPPPNGHGSGGEHTAHLSPGKPRVPKLVVPIESDEALKQYFEAAAACRLYAEIKVSVETLNFSISLAAPGDAEGDKGDSELQTPLRIMLGGQPHDVLSSFFNQITMEIVEARGLPLTASTSSDGGGDGGGEGEGKKPSGVVVVLRKVPGMIDKERSTQAVDLGPRLSWNEELTLQCSHRLYHLEVAVVADGNEVGRALMPVHDFMDKLAAASTSPPGNQVVELNTWLKLQDGNEQEAKFSRLRCPELKVKARMTFNIPYVFPHQRVTLPRHFQIGLAWDFAPGEEPIDFDASLAGLNSKHELVEQVWYNRLVGFHGAVHHSGDDRTGQGDGDDETITIDSEHLSHTVDKLIVCINSFTGTPISKASHAYVRVVVEGRTQAFYGLSGSRIPESTGLFLGCLHRSMEGGWFFYVVSEAVPGCTLKESLPAIVKHGKLHLGWR